ncbi:hypothetical protein SDC9_140389 [bioreactor metagenome]|uniref:Uncharacterized protein n=1 Tax=bioreactor metagenome TaxID=1076179 RepID=A0A645DXC2_9ZZZZ
MQMAVVKPGDDGVSLEIHKLTFFGSRGQHGFAFADHRNLSIFDQHGLLKMSAIDIDLAVYKYAVHSALLVRIFYRGNQSQV